MSLESVIREPLITGGKTVHDVTEDISRRVEEKPTKLWMLAMTISLGLLAVGAYTVFLLLWHFLYQLLRKLHSMQVLLLLYSL